jgi:aminoglycoside/choline kinase family phosphotransferase
MPQRLSQINDWLQKDLGIGEYDIQPASSDASFRRYFRVTSKSGKFDAYGVGGSLIVMDAPPPQENVKPFIYVSKLLEEMGLNVPVVLEKNIENGFLLLSDLGAVQYLDVLSESNVEKLYDDALGALLRLQKNGPRQSDFFPIYDRAFFQRELNIFTEWYLEKHLGIRLSKEQQAVIENTHNVLIESALEQPVVLVHRDFHSRNLMLTEKNNPGILDFQDAVIGPVTYDLVSLLKDCYIEWPGEKVKSWCLFHKNQIEKAGIIEQVSEQQFLRWFDLMGAQRHMKAIGIFARLDQRDGKPDYLNDIPRTLSYVYGVASGYVELNSFKELLLSINPLLATNSKFY